MDLFERMKDIFGADISPFELRLEVLGFKSLGIFGGGKVVYISESEIVVDGKTCIVTVSGKALKIARSENGELYIAGEIEKIERNTR